MKKEKLAQVLGRQLKGIMLHVDLCKHYILHGNKRWAIKHYNHVLCETRNFMLTNQLAIEYLGEIIEPVREAQIILPAEEDKLFGIWQSYERDTANLYHQLADEDPSCCWWKKLHHETMKEIQHIKLF